MSTEYLLMVEYKLENLGNVRFYLAPRISDDNKYIAYTPITSWDAEWRNYRGGQAMPIWIVDLKTKELIKTPQLDGERHINPVWFKGEVFYISERDYTANIWSYNINTKEEKQFYSITKEKD